MSFDLNILCVLQESPVRQFSFSSPLYFDIMNENMHDLHKGYNYESGWRLIGSIPGFWYYLFAPMPDESEKFLGSYYLCDFSNDEEMKDIHFDSNFRINEFSEWKGGLAIRDPYKDDFRRIVKYFIDLSPVKMVVILARYQDDEHEYILGNFPLGVYFSMLDKGEVAFNVCYVVTADAT